MTVRGGGDAGVVGDHDEGGAMALLDLGENLEDFCRVDAVEVAGGLVGEEHLRFVDESAGDGHALAFAGGELGGVLAQAMLETELDEEGAGALFAVAAVAAGTEHRDLNVFKSIEGGEQVEGLEDEASVAGAVGIEVDADGAGLRSSDRLAAKEDGAIGGDVEAAGKWSKVDLPLPLAPVMARKSPAVTLRETPRRASMVPFS